MIKRVLPRFKGVTGGAVFLLGVSLCCMKVQAHVLQKSTPKKSSSPAPKASGNRAVSLAKGGLPPGIIVCEPVAASNIAPDLADVAAGWGDWLFLMVGGQPELGQTPMITSVSRAQREISHTNDLRLGVDDACRVARSTGANRVAVGTLRKTDALLLSYTIYDAATGNALGKPLEITGSPEIIRKQLPVFASEMAHRLGAASPNIPGSIEAATAELGTVGRTFWAPWTAVLNPADLKTLEEASSHDSLAASTF